MDQKVRTIIDVSLGEDVTSVRVSEAEDQGNPGPWAPTRIAGWRGEKPLIKLHLCSTQPHVTSCRGSGGLPGRGRCKETSPNVEMSRPPLLVARRVYTIMGDWISAG